MEKYQERTYLYEDMPLIVDSIYARGFLKKETEKSVCVGIQKKIMLLFNNGITTESKFIVY